MQLFTFSQKKIARAKYNLSLKARALDSLDDEIRGVEAHLAKLKASRIKLELKALAVKRDLNAIERRFAKSEGARNDEPLEAKLGLNPDYTRDGAHKGWLKMTYHKAQVSG